MSANPYSSTFDLGPLTERPVEVTLSPTSAQRAAIARWLGVAALDTFRATIRLWRTQTDRYVYEASFEADVEQACVVTLEPVRSHLSGEFSRHYTIAPRPRRGALSSAPHAIAPADDEQPEMLSNPFLDVAAPVLEELSLALDPYPRAPGAVLELPAGADNAPANPFAILQSLKDGTKSSSPPAMPAKPARTSAVRRPRKTKPAE